MQRELITVWEFRSIDGKQVVVKILPLYPDDRRYAHEYQRIIFQGYRHEYKA